MQYFLPRRKTLSGYFQPLNVDLPEGGDPRWEGFEFNPLLPMQVLESTKVLHEDTVFYAITGQFTGASVGQTPPSDCWLLITLVHNGQHLPLANKPQPLTNITGTNKGQLPIKPTLFVPAGDSIIVQVFSLDRTNNLNVEVVLWGAKVPPGWKSVSQSRTVGKSRLGDIRWHKPSAAVGLTQDDSQVNPYQAFVLSSKSVQLDTLQSPNLDALGDQAPPGASPLVLTSTQQFNYPAPGAAVVTIFSYTVPPGQRVRVFEHALVNLGGNFQDMLGNVIWRFLVNGAPLKGLGAQIAQIGNFQTPDRVVLWLTENDLFTVTVEVKAGAPAQTGLTAYRINGWTRPLFLEAQ